MVPKDTISFSNSELSVDMIVANNLVTCNLVLPKGGSSTPVAVLIGVF